MSLRTDLLVILGALALASCGEDAVQSVKPYTAPGTPAGEEPDEVYLVRLKIGDGKILPVRITVPASREVQFTLRNTDDEPVAVTLDGKWLEEAPGRVDAITGVKGLKAGRHVLETSTGGRATIEAE